MQREAKSDVIDHHELDTIYGPKHFPQQSLLTQTLWDKGSNIIWGAKALANKAGYRNWGIRGQT